MQPILLDTKKIDFILELYSTKITTQNLQENNHLQSKLIYLKKELFLNPKKEIYFMDFFASENYFLENSIIQENIAKKFNDSNHNVAYDYELFLLNRLSSSKTFKQSIFKSYIYHLHHNLYYPTNDNILNEMASKVFISNEKYLISTINLILENRDTEKLINGLYSFFIENKKSDKFKFDISLQAHMDFIEVITQKTSKCNNLKITPILNSIALNITEQQFIESSSSGTHIIKINLDLLQYKTNSDSLSLLRSSIIALNGYFKKFLSAYETENKEKLLSITNIIHETPLPPDLILKFSFDNIKNYPKVKQITELLFNNFIELLMKDKDAFIKNFPNEKVGVDYVHSLIQSFLDFENFDKNLPVSNISQIKKYKI